MLLHKPVSLHIEEYLSPYLCGYRKRFTTQQALLSLLERWKNVLDKKGYGEAVLMDLSKAFDTLNHDFLIAMLHVSSINKALFNKSKVKGKGQRSMRVLVIGVNFY